MRWRFTSLLFIAVLALGQSKPEPALKPYDEPEAYDVYAAALTQHTAKKELLISETTIPFEQCVESRSDKLVNAAINDYKDKNKMNWRLQPQFKLEQKYKLLSGAQIDRLAQKNSKNGLWKFPAGTSVIRFSAIGFSTDKTIAFLEMDEVCGALCGRGFPVILKKLNGKWSDYYSPPVKNPDGTSQPSVECVWLY